MSTLLENPAAELTPQEVRDAVRDATAGVKKEKKSAPKKKGKKAPATKAESALAVSIMAAASLCADYGVVARPFGSDTRPSMVIKLPAWSEVKAKLPATEVGTTIAQCFHALQSAVGVLCGDAGSTWVIHTSGSFALYGKLNG